METSKNTQELLMKYQKKHQAFWSFIQQRLSPKRFRHVQGVAEAAVELGKRYDADLEDCYLAGLAHDIAKEDVYKRQQ